MRGRGLLLLALLPAPCAAQVPDSVELRFAWPIGTTVDVHASRWRARTGQADTLDVAARYRIEVQAHAQGRLIRYSNLALDANAEPGAASVEAALERIAGLLPSYIVGADGEFIRLHDLSAYRRGVERLVRDIAGEPEMASRILTLLQPMLSEQALTATVAREWDMLVGLWAGADLEVGAVYEYEDRSYVPLAPDVPIPMIAEFSVAERLACPAATRRRCVRIEHISTVDEDSVARAVRAVLERFTAGSGVALKIDDFEIENLLELVTEPTTLLPHTARLSNSVRLRFTGGGRSSRADQFEVRTYEFRYR